MTENPKVVLITGASSGIGEAVAREMLGRGWRVYGAARRTDRFEALVRDGMRPVDLDVTDAGSRSRCVREVLAEAGRIDGLVNNAGYGSYGAVEEVPLDEARRQFEVNLFGLAGMCQEVLPSMRARRAGRIVNISSMGGRIYTPLGGWYHATKHALEALSDAMRHELRPFGIQVVVVQPGAIRSEWVAHSARSMETVSGQGPYAPAAEAMARVLRDTYREGRAAPPECIARLVRRALTARRPRARYAGPLDAQLFLLARKYLPDSVFDWMVHFVTSPGSPAGIPPNE